jgi:parallel beta-helix repeat protein
MGGGGAVLRCVACSLLAGALLVPLLAVSPLALAWTVRPPILIDGDAEFTSFNGVIAGTGTAADPYIIGGWDIVPSFWGGITVQNANAHFLIDDVHVHGGEGCGILLYNVTHGHVANARVEDASLGVCVSSSPDATVETSTIERSASNGVSIWDSDGVVVSGNRIADSYRAGVLLSWSTNVTMLANSLESDGLDVFGSDIAHFTSHTIPTHNLVNGLPLRYHANCTNLNLDGVPTGQLVLANCADVRATNLRISNVETAIYAPLTDRLVVADGNFTAIGDIAVRLYQTTNLTVERNEFFNVSYSGVTCGYCADVHVQDNAFVAAGGIAFWYSSNLYVLRNTISGSTHTGIEASDSQNVTVSGNSVEDAWIGIHVRGPNATVSGNTATRSERNGLFLWIANGSVTDNVVTFTNPTGWNTYVGGLTVGGTNVVVSGNTVLRTIGYGIWLDYARGARVHHNDFVENTEQAYDEGGVGNAWDDGYPSGGNFWSDFVGEDSCSGPSQNVCTAGDGLGDVPYPVPSDTVAQDRYPRMSPVHVFDTVPPVTTASVSGIPGREGWYLTNVTVGLDAEDDLAGVSEIEYRTDGGVWQSYGGPFILREGRHVVEYRAIDHAGNTESIRTGNVSVDPTPPSVAILSPAGEAGLDVTVSWTASDSASGIASYEVSLDDAPFVSVGSNTSTVLHVVEGDHSVRVRAADVAGNWAMASVAFRASARSAAASVMPLVLLTVVPFVGAAVAVTLWLRRRRREV